MRSISLFLFLLFFSSVFYSCKEEEEEPILTMNYEGKIAVVYTKDLPAISAVAKLDVSIQKDGTVTFTGQGASQSFDEEGILYDGDKPVTKIRMAGTLTFYDASGTVQEVQETGATAVLVLTHTVIEGQMTVWAWDDEMGWIQVLDVPYTYEDEFSDGGLQFDLAQACGPFGEDIATTQPDIYGTFTSGYNLTLVGL